MGSTIHDVLWQAWGQFDDEVVTVLPHILASLFVFVLGLMMGVVAGRLLTWMLSFGQLDRYAERVGLAPSLRAIGIASTARALVVVLQGGIVLFASLLALYSLDARLASELAERFFLYLPHLVVAVVILGAGLVVAKFLSRSVLINAVNSEVRPARLLSGLTRVAVLIVAGAMAFEHLGISRETVLTAFAILFGGVTLAAAIAAGLGLQDFVRQWVAGQASAGRAAGQENPIDRW